MSERISLSKIEVNGSEMEYVRFGEGSENLIIIPGLSIKSVLTAAGAIAYAYSIFAKDYTVYLFDRRKDVYPGITLNVFADDIVCACKKLGIEKTVLFGVSMGGMISQIIAINEPTLVSKLVLASTASRAGDSATNVIGKWMLLAAAGDKTGLGKDFVDKLYSEEYASKFGGMVVQVSAACTDEEMERFFILAGSCAGFDVYDKLDRIQCPVFVMGAVHDKVVGSQASFDIAQKINCDIFMYGGKYGHAVYDEAPDFKEKILEFLKK